MDPLMDKMDYLEFLKWFDDCHFPVQTFVFWRASCTIFAFGNWMAWIFCYLQNKYWFTPYLYLQQQINESPSVENILSTALKTWLLCHKLFCVLRYEVNQSCHCQNIVIRNWCHSAHAMKEWALESTQEETLFLERELNWGINAPRD